MPLRLILEGERFFFFFFFFLLVIHSCGELELSSVCLWSSLLHFLPSPFSSNLSDQSL